MRLEQTKREVQTVGVMERAKATIKATPKIFSFFENSTYSNKPRAIARELVANGVDSHTEAGISHRAVEVTLPCELDPVFKVRDFGVGMTHEFLMGAYMAYTDGSTKDQANDQIGGFGIGSKSPFAYTDQYTVRSVRDGQLGVYVVAKDEEGIPEIGCLGRQPTTEPSGVEVSFPVEVDDIADFLEAAQEALQYFKPIPVVINGTIDAPSYSYEGQDWAIRHEAGELGVIMGGVRYPVTATNLEYGLRFDSRLAPLLEYGLDLWMPIGSCGVALSREALQYEGSTSANIRAKLEGLIDEVVLTFSTIFDEQPSLWEAKKALAKLIGTNMYNARSKLLLANAQYHGQPLTLEVRVHSQSFAGSAWYILSERERRAATSLKTMSWEDLTVVPLEPAKIGAVFIDDLPQSPKSKIGAKVRAWVDENGRSKPLVVLRASGDNTDATRMRVLLSLIGNPIDVIYTSSLPEPSRVARSVNKDRPRVRMFTFNGSTDKFTHTQISNLNPSQSKEGRVFEIAYLDQPATGILVVMNSFDLPSGFHDKMKAGLIEFDELHFVNAGDAPKLDWPRFEDVFQERLADALADYPELPQRLALYRNAELGPWFGHARELRKLSATLSPAQQRRPFGRVCALYETYLAPLTSVQHQLAPFVTVALPPRIDPAKLVEAIETEQADACILFQRLELDNASELALLLKNL